jgi:peptidoglycan/LPS O-acetylase OafA/YrhL
VRSESSVRLTGHLLGLDGVRGLAILLVMAVHFVGDATPQTMLQRLVVKGAGYGLLGVDLFFVLSGFLITGLLLEAKGRPHYFRNFYARRTLRIFPLYYFVLAVLFLAVPLLATPSELLEQARRHQVWLWTYTSNFYIAATSSWTSLTYVSHFWSLAIEEHFYLLWPLVVLSLSRRGLVRLCLGVMAAGLALRIGLALGGVSELSISVLTPCRIDTLCVGGLLAVLVREEGGLASLVESSGRAALALGAALIVLSAFCALAKVGLPVLHQIRNTLYALFFGTLTLVSLKAPANLVARAFQGGLLRFFGKYSYGLYVYHGIFTWVLFEHRAEARLDALLGNHALAIAARAALGVSVLVAVAGLSYQLLEKRFLALKRYFEVPEGRAGAADGLPAAERVRPAGVPPPARS